MRAVQIDNYGRADELHEVELPMPEPGAGEIRVRVRAAAVNPGDYKWREGRYKEMGLVTLPQIIGHDIAGEVDAVGEGVAAPALGDRVVVLLSPVTQGGYAEQVVVPAETAVPIPDTLDYATAAAIPAAGVTGWQLVAQAAISPGDLVAITGATGAVGRFATYAAHRAGARVVAAVRAAHVNEARALAGVVDVVVLGGDDWQGAPFSRVIDTVGGPEVLDLCRHLTDDGLITTAVAPPVSPDGKKPPVFVMLEIEPAALRTIVEGAAAGDISIPIARRMKLAEAADAHRLVEQGGLGGKIILEP